MWVDVLKSFNHITILQSISVPAPPPPVNTTAVWFNSTQHALPWILFGENVLKNLELSRLAPYIEVMEMGVMIYMCKCTKSSTLQRHIVPKWQKSLKHAFNHFSLKGCWVLPLKKVAVFKISNCWWGVLGTVLPSTSVTAASSWSSPLTPGGGSWLCGAAGPERSYSSSHTDIWRVCGRGSAFGGHS